MATASDPFTRKKGETAAQHRTRLVSAGLSPQEARRSTAQTKVKPIPPRTVAAPSAPRKPSLTSHAVGSPSPGPTGRGISLKRSSSSRSKASHGPLVRSASGGVNLHGGTRKYNRDLRGRFH